MLFYSQPLCYSQALAPSDLFSISSVLPLPEYSGMELLGYMVTAHLFYIKKTKTKPDFCFIKVVLHVFLYFILILALF